jgi:hypothetical protein
MAVCSEKYLTEPVVSSYFLMIFREAEESNTFVHER